MTYSLNIVESLREKGIYPTATSNSQRGNDSPSNALDYTLDNYYCSSNNGKIQWIMFDFQTIVALKSYQINVKNKSNNLNSWNLSVSNDKINWRYVSSYNEVPKDSAYDLDRIENIRYVKIEGTSSDTPSTYISITYVKFFGSLTVKPTKNICTCKRKTIANNNIPIIFLLCIYSY